MLLYLYNLYERKNKKTLVDNAEKQTQISKKLEGLKANAKNDEENYVFQNVSIMLYGIVIKNKSICDGVHVFYSSKLEKSR